MALTIGELARRAGVGVETIRFYEREGLLVDPPRAPSGHRRFPEHELDRLLFIRRAKELGFTLAETRELLALQATRGASCGRVKRHVEEKLVDIERRLQTLRRMKRVLRKLHAACDGEDLAIGECPILEALGADGG